MTQQSSSQNLVNVGHAIGRYGLVVILLWYGIFKFTQTEADAIDPLISNSFFFSWMKSLFDIFTISVIIGITEIVVALAIAVRPWSASAAFYGSAMGIVIFALTLSFMFTTPGMIRPVEWLYVPNGFLIKDLLFLGFCVWSTGEARQAMQTTTS